MYTQITPKLVSRQEGTNIQTGFTLVEIMIVIVIIVLLTQLGNIGGLFRTQEQSRLGEVSAQIMNMIDIEKTNVLLGKTQTVNNSIEIVRKRAVEVSLDNTSNAVTLTSKVNLASNNEFTYEESTTKTWTLPKLTGTWYTCNSVGSAAPLSSPTPPNPITLEFRDDETSFDSSITSPHLVLQLQLNQSFEEIHIDRRTGLTFTRKSLSTVTCN